MTSIPFTMTDNRYECNDINIVNDDETPSTACNELKSQTFGTGPKNHDTLL